MKLNAEEAELFFELAWAVQFYVNTQKTVIADLRSIKEFIELPQEQKQLVRDALYDFPELIDDYVSENPDKLDEGKLRIVKRWKSHVRGDFYIERYLKKYAVFIGGNNNVYGVLALHRRFDDMFPKNYLPTYIKTVLLPFRDKIVYDGFMQVYSISFGGGVKRSLKDTYMKAKQNEKIITTLNGERTSGNKIAKPKVKHRDWSKELERITSVAKTLKGGVDQPVINGPVFSLLKSSIELANQAIVNSSDIDTLRKELRKVETAKRKVETILNRIE